MGTDIFHDIRATLTSAFFALPLLLINFTAFLAMAIGSPSLFMLLIGQLLLLCTTFLFHIVGDIAALAFPWLKPHIFVTSDRANLLQSGSGITLDVNVLPSYWMVQVLFFLSYLLANAQSVYEMEADPNANEWQVTNRRMKAITITILITTVMIGLVSVRWRLTGAETIAGVAIAAIAGIGVGFGWYELAKLCGARDSDIFGIIPQMSPNSGVPTTCIYTPVA